MKIPTGVRSSVSGLPSLDEMLGGGLEGNWILAGATSVGKTTLAASFLGNDDGVNQNTSGGIFDFGMRQGQDRYLSRYDKRVRTLNEFLEEDKERIISSFKWLAEDSEPSRGRALYAAQSKWFYALTLVLTVYDKGRGWFSEHRFEKIPAKNVIAELGKSSGRDIVKVSFRNAEKVVDVDYYFGRDRVEDLKYREQLVAAVVYNTFKVGGARRFVVDGINLANDLVKEKVLMDLWLYFNGEKEIPFPFVGTNAEEFVNFSKRGTWCIDQTVAVLNALTLSGDPTREDVTEIDEGVRNARAYGVVQEADGLIVLGQNLKRNYFFAGDGLKAPSLTRILTIAKSRYEADETYREYCLDGERKPVLGRALIRV